MARYGRLGQMISQDPELTAKYGPPNPEDISSYGSRSGGAIDVTQYWGDAGVDVEKSMKLSQLRKIIGPSMDNKIIESWYKQQGDDPYHTYRYSGNMFAKAQDYFLTNTAPLLERKMGLRDAHKKKNPMVYPSYLGDERE